LGGPVRAAVRSFAAACYADAEQERELPVLRAAFASFLLVLCACTPAADEEAADVDTPTPRNPFFGTWQVTHASVAPWWKGPGEGPDPDPAMDEFTLHADKTIGAPLLTCTKPSYATNIVPARGLFQGNLPDPPKDAAALGFTAPDITVLTYSCTDNNADISLDFPMRDDGQIMLGLDNVVYTFRRTGD
jgi:hypothetical protein